MQRYLRLMPPLPAGFVCTRAAAIGRGRCRVWTRVLTRCSCECVPLLVCCSRALALRIHPPRTLTHAPHPAQLVGVASDFAWFVGTSALLIALPVLVEIQRETTVLVLQKQREVELAAIQEQARAQNGGVVEQVKGFGQLIAAAASSGQQQ